MSSFYYSFLTGRQAGRQTDRQTLAVKDIFIGLSLLDIILTNIELLLEMCLMTCVE